MAPLTDGSRHRRRRRLRDPADQHPAAGRRGRAGAGPQGRPLVGGDAADDGRRRARLRAPARRDAGVRGQPRSRRGATSTRGSRSRSASSWPTTCRAPAAPRTTCWPPPSRFVPSIELIDTRITDWKIKLCDTIADNASSAGFVLGKARVSPADIDIKDIDAVLTRNGEVVAEGRSDAVLGNPVTAVAWLARKVDELRGAAARRRHRVARVVHAGDRCTSRRRFRRRLRGPGFSPAVVRIARLLKV